MARTGLYPSDVKRARDSLLAAGKRPSLAAIRAALGDTGSLSTISRYLKEIGVDDKEATEGQKRSVSESIHDLIDRLGSELQRDADATLEQGRHDLMERERGHLERIQALEVRSAELERSVTQLTADLSAERAAHLASQEALNEASMQRARLEQQATELYARLKDHEEHRKSLEDKHQQARLTLDHFRLASKEQRDQEHQRHGEQVHQLQTELHQVRQSLAGKGEEITRLSGEGSRLLTELSILRTDLDTTKQRAERAEKSLQKVERENDALKDRVSTALSSVDSQSAELATALAKAKALEVDLIASKTEGAVQAAQISDLRTMVAQQQELLKRGMGKIPRSPT